jgi:hypothetical protein
MSTNQAGKGDKPRPVNKEKYDKQYDEIAWRKTVDKISQVIRKKGKISYKY